MSIQPKRAAVDYIPSEKDVDPDSLAEGKGQQDVEARDMRDDNAGDRGGIHTSALRDLASDSLVVLHGGRKVAHWEGAALQAAIDDGTLDPRRIEASAIEAAMAAGLLIGQDQAGFTRAVHAYLAKRAEDAQAELLLDPDAAAPLDDPEWLEEITPCQVQRALMEVDPALAVKLTYPGLASGTADTLKRDPAAYTELKCVGLNGQPGEIQSYSPQTPELDLFADPEWSAVEQQFGPEFTQTHLTAALASYRGPLTIPGPAVKRHTAAWLPPSGKRWVRCITPDGARKLIS